MPVHTRWHAVLAKPYCLPPPCASPCAPSRQAAEASCPTAVPPLVPTFSPARVDNVVVQAPGLAQSPPPRSAQAVPRRCPRRGSQLLAQRGGRRPWLTHEPWPTDPWLGRSQRPSLHGVDTGGACGGAGEGPTPPSSTAAPSRPSRSDCRHGRLGMTVCAPAPPNGANAPPVKSETLPPYSDANGED